MRSTILLLLSLFMAGCSTLPEKIAEPPKYITEPTPTYPILSRRIGEEGKVILKVKVLANGSVGDASIQTSSTFPRLDMAALECLTAVKFVPAKTTHGNFVDSWVLLSISFKLDDLRVPNPAFKRGALKPHSMSDVTDADLDEAHHRVEQLEKEQAALIAQAKLANIDVSAVLSRHVFVDAKSAGEFQQYVDVCLAHILENVSIEAPPEARAKVASVAVTISVDRAGNILNVAPLQGSNVPAFDNAVVEAIRAVPPCGAVPSKNPNFEELVIHVPLTLQ